MSVTLSSPSPLTISPARTDQLVTAWRAVSAPWSWATKYLPGQLVTDNRNYDLTETDRKQKAEEGGGGRTDIIESDKNAGFLASHNRRNSLKHYVFGMFGKTYYSLRYESEWLLWGTQIYDVICSKTRIYASVTLECVWGHSSWF